MPATDVSTVLDVADRLFAAIERSDVAAVEQLFDPSVTVWKSGDDRPNGRERSVRVIRWFIDSTVARRYDVLDWQRLDPGRSTVAFACRSAWGLVTVRGTFSRVRGSAQITGDGMTFGSISIDVASPDTGIARRDGHLASPAYFDAQKHPTITDAVSTAPDTVDLHIGVTVKGAAAGVNATAGLESLPDGAIRVTTAATPNHHAFGMDGNLLGMVADEAAVSGDVVFMPG
ncbi:YceI family protein [Mycobacterium sp. Y57]|uniref:YceI family protein n=1 Tax=Mycolicibacterium xanthum TaxID=2796469 RepID=UPI001C853381|nr:YceI family protein [Mycolicibacterium xanthum]MBX7433633.1 YceI family protein [Mycolicibacterium xanthum]